MVTWLSVNRLRLNRRNKAVLVISPFCGVVINVPIARARIPTMVLILKPGTIMSSI